MSKDIVAKQSTLPAHLQKAATARAAAKEFSGGVQSGFPVLGYRGKTWRVKQGGEEQVYTDEEGDAIQNVRLVLIRSNENLSKTYYKGSYTEGSNEKPTCWSASGIKPDPNVQTPVSSQCQGCPMNQWGSRINKDTGAKQKACADVRRMAVIMEHELEAVVAGDKDVDDAAVMLLRVPGSSLNPLKDYVEKKLLPKGGLLPYMLVTRVGFDTDAAYPKFTWKAARFLDEDEFGTVEELRDADIVKRIINEAAELEDEGTTEEDSDEPGSVHDAKGEGSDSAPSESSEEDHMDDDDDDDIAPPPAKKKAKKRAAQVEEDSFDEDDEDEIAPPKKKAAKKKAPVKKKVSKPEPEDDESPVADEDDLDDMLDSILG